VIAFRMSGISGRPHVNLLTSFKQTWRNPTSFIGNLVSNRESASSVLSSLRARSNACSLDGTCMVGLWVGSARGSRRALRTHSPRILCRCPVLRRQILSVCRRDMGAESRGHRGRPALPQGRACANRAGHSLDGAVMRLTGPRPDAPRRRA